MTDASAALGSRLAKMGDGFGAVVATFHEVVGPELARVATPTSLRRGTLTIRCTSASWAQTINMMEAELIDRLTPRLGRGRVARIVARAGGATPAPPVPPPPPLPPIDPASIHRLEQMVEHIEDPALRARVLAAAIATHRRRAASENPAL